MRRGLVFPHTCRINCPNILVNSLENHFFQPLSKTVNSTSSAVKTGVARHCRTLWSAHTCSSDVPEKLVLPIAWDHEHAELEILLTEVFLVYIKEVEKIEEGREKLRTLPWGQTFLFFDDRVLTPVKTPRPAPCPGWICSVGGPEQDSHPKRLLSASRAWSASTRPRSVKMCSADSRSSRARSSPTSEMGSLPSARRARATM